MEEEAELLGFLVGFVGRIDLEGHLLEGWRYGMAPDLLDGMQLIVASVC
jgi:hypothetical protein